MERRRKEVDLEEARRQAEERKRREEQAEVRSRRQAEEWKRRGAGRGKE